MRQAVRTPNSSPVSSSTASARWRTNRAAGQLDEGESIPLRLLSSRAVKTGVVYLVYTRDDVERTGTYEDAKLHLPQDWRWPGNAG
ncbi:hypothetical protein [Mycolicibacterium sp. P9-64]|uniref:hypothetical protein n=1 Tax=Mycolicibacterium sp. P9-64 TaxID=2024612 RepID=UPI0011EC87C8|nr:hypothetical protein [Mycolicibacterium sp. P9-64]